MIAPAETIRRVKEVYGTTIQEILAKEGEFDRLDVLGAIQILVGSKILKKLPASRSEMMIFALSWMGIEVQNGGFYQYFVNSAGDFWRDVLWGLEVTRDSAGLQQFQRLISVFPSSAPAQNRDERLFQLETIEAQLGDRLSEHFTRLNDDYFSAPFPDWNLAFDYVKSHQSDFNLETA